MLTRHKENKGNSPKLLTENQRSNAVVTEVQYNELKDKFEKISDENKKLTEKLDKIEALRKQLDSSMISIQKSYQSVLAQRDDANNWITILKQELELKNSQLEELSLIKKSSVSSIRVNPLEKVNSAFSEIQEQVTAENIEIDQLQNLQIELN